MVWNAAKGGGNAATSLGSEGPGPWNAATGGGPKTRGPRRKSGQIGRSLQERFCGWRSDGPGPWNAAQGGNGWDTRRRRPKPNHTGRIHCERRHGWGGSENPRLYNFWAELLGTPPWVGVRRPAPSERRHEWGSETRVHGTPPRVGVELPPWAPTPKPGQWIHCERGHGSGVRRPGALERRHGWGSKTRALHPKSTILGGFTRNIAFGSDDPGP